MRHLHRHLPHFIGKVQYSGGALALNLGKLSNIETRVSFNLHHCHVILVETVETIKTGFLERQEAEEIAVELIFQSFPGSHSSSCTRATHRFQLKKASFNVQCEDMIMALEFILDSGCY